MRVLVTGAGGQLGHELVATFADHDVVAAGHDELDVTDRSAVLDRVRQVAPDVVLHAGAWTAVDACELDRERALVVNGRGTEHVVEAARVVAARVVYFSTDYVFDGEKPEPYLETDAPNPRSAYGASKLAGERAVDPAHDLIVRVSWVSGLHGSNMVKTIVRLAAEHDTLAFVDDQRGNPTFADDIARMTRTLVDAGHAGTFHVTNQGSVTWYEFARSVLGAAGLDPDRVRPIATAELQPPRPAPRPANSVLDNAALHAAGIPLLPHYEEPLARLVRALETQPASGR
jgi:dTDP-4-dehydrorhamnose reductase